MGFSSCRSLHPSLQHYLLDIFPTSHYPVLLHLYHENTSSLLPAIGSHSNWYVPPYDQAKHDITVEYTEF